MGCWNETCLISQLPILAGEDTYMFILAPTIAVDIEGPMCYPDDRYVPIGFPICGKYDDYGGLEEVKSNPILENFLQSFDKLMYYDRMSDNKAMIEYKWESLDKFVSDIIDHTVYINVPTKGYKMLTTAFVHKGLYESLIDEVSNRIPFAYDKDFYSVVERSIYTAIEKLETAKNSGHVFAKFTDFAFGCNNKYRYMNRMIDLYLENEDPCIVKGVTDYLVWMDVMSLSRRGYHGYSGSGGQDREYRLPQIIAEFITEKCNSYETRAIEEGCERYDALAETLYYYEEP